MPPVERQIADLGRLLDQEPVLDEIGAEILHGGHSAIRYRETRPGGKSMVFVAHQADVAKVLTAENDFSLCHYSSLYSEIAPPGAFIIMRPEGPARAERMAILRAAASRTPWFGPDPQPRRDVARACVDNVIAAVRRRRRFDLIGEYGFFVPYLLAKQVLGLGGSPSFSILPLIICLLNRHSLFQLLRRETCSYLTDLGWSEFIVAQLLKNFENRQWWILMWARPSAQGLRRQIERYVDIFPRTAGDKTLLNALWAVRQEFSAVPDERYREHVVSTTIELAATLLPLPGLAFSGIIKRWLKPDGPGLGAMLRLLGAMDARDFVQEQLRLAPPSAKLLRNATRRVDLGDLTVEAGEYVCALVKSAGLDTDAPGEVGAGRPAGAYLHFGPENGPHQCFAHRFAPDLLAEMFLGLARLTAFHPRGRLTSFKNLLPGRLTMALR